MEKRETERPFISREAVRQALNAMLYASRPTHNPLYHLTLVSRILNDPTFPAVENPRVFATRQLLIEYITQGLKALRQNFGLPQPTLSETRLDAQVAIAVDAQTEFPEFIGVSLLYYRYVRVDLNISPREYSTLTFIDERTLRRYQDSAVAQLTDTIALREWEVRQYQQETYLKAKIPVGTSEKLFGRADLIKRLSAVIDNRESARIFLTGPHGIGKTAVVKALIKKQISENKIDNLVWVLNPHSARYVSQHIYERVVQDPRISLQEYTLMYRLTIVIDDLHLFDDEQALTLADTLKGLFGVCVIIVNTSYVPLDPDFEHVIVPEIDKQDVLALITASGRSNWRDEQEEFQSYAEELWRRVGGNPMAIKLIAGRLVNLHTDKPLVADGEQIVDHIFATGYASLDDNTRCTLFMCSLVASDEFYIEDIHALWPEYTIKHEGILALLSTGFITIGDSANSYRLYEIARQFVQNLYKKIPDVQRVVLNLLDHLDYLSAESDIALATLQNILRQPWLTIDSRLRYQWAYFVANHERVNHADQVAAFENVAHLTPQMKIAYASSLRRTGDIDLAEKILVELVSMTGESGDFLLQGRGLIELCILYHYLGNYKSAISHLERVKRVGIAYNDEFLLYRCLIEQAQITLETGEIQTAQETLEVISIDKLDAASRLVFMLVQGEFHLQKQNVDRALHFAHLAMDIAHETKLGRVYTLMGRIEVERNKWDEALHWLDAGIACLEWEVDLFALARAKSNLAAVMLLRRSNFEFARQLLDEALKLQRLIKDRVGMAFTLHNMHILNRTHLD